MKSKINFIFNAHLPFVRHPEYPKFLEEDWLYEAINESYLPLLRMMKEIAANGYKFRLTFSLSPTLCSMLKDNLLMERFSNYLLSRAELGEKEVKRLENNKKQQEIAQMYLDNIYANINFFNNQCNRNIISYFRLLSEEGYLELITSPATQAYLPLYKDCPVAVNAQIEAGIAEYAKNFNKVSDGFWLPQCGYYPGLEDILKRNYIDWVSLSSQSLLLGDAEPKRGNYAPIKCSNGLYCFARDYNLTSLVWSPSEGYPGDSDYREFYRDIGYDLDLDYIRPYIHEPEVRVFTGFKYYAVTGKNENTKKLYNKEKASLKVKEHAEDFIKHVKDRTKSLSKALDLDPIYTLSFDAELFGHFWYEGVQWIENIIKLANEDENVVLMTPRDYIAENHDIQTMQPAFSSWAEGGYSQAFVDSSSNSWLCRYTIKSAERMVEIAERNPNQKSLKMRFLNQAARETLLLMAGDWPFILHNHSSAQYANKRVVQHIQNLNLVYDDMCKNTVNTEWLVKAERKNNIFPDIDYNIFSQKHFESVCSVYDVRTDKEN